MNKRLSTSFAAIALLALLSSASPLHSQAVSQEEFDSYKLRIDTDWFYVNPSGQLRAQTNGTQDTGAPIDFSKDLGFSTYSTFYGKVDWHFKRKQHLYIALAPFNISHQRVLTRTFTFQGQTFNAGIATSASLNTFFIAPGYEYDFIRRKRGHLGLAAQFNLFNTKAKVNSVAGVASDTGTAQAAKSAQGSLFSPVPVLGPAFRFYVTNSPKVFVDGNLFGMYLFGYGNYISTAGIVGINFSKHFAATAGYTLASKLNVNTAKDRIGLDATDKGVVVGLQTSF
jgi:hypothetical protein